MSNLILGATSQKALELYRSKTCPHCGKRISKFEAASMLWGDGYRQLVAVRTEGGKEVIPLEEFNPQTMELLND
jgi:hypothetical protein